MIFGNPADIAFTYEVLARQQDSHFVFGTFNIFIDDLLLINGGSNWTIDCIVSTLKNTSISLPSENFSGCKQELFEKAYVSRGYELHNATQFPSEWWGSNEPLISQLIDIYLRITNANRTYPPFGTELCLYCELEDLNLRIFLFTTDDGDRIIYSKNHGKTVFEKLVLKGTVEKVIESLPNTV